MINIDQNYWKTNFDDPFAMDGIGNAKEHCRYIKGLFALDLVEVESIIDFGFGLGHLFEEMIKTFRPKTALGIEPSSYAFKQFKARAQFPSKSRVSLRPQSIEQFIGQKNFKQVFDLGICTSVLQYIADKQLKYCIPHLAQRCRYLYLTVPTNRELDRQVKDHDFRDEYAIRRSRTFYQKLLRPHFTFISNRLLESKAHFSEGDSSFTEYIFRF